MLKLITYLEICQNCPLIVKTPGQGFQAEGSSAVGEPSVWQGRETSRLGMSLCRPRRISSAVYEPRPEVNQVRAPPFMTDVAE